MKFIRNFFVGILLLFGVLIAVANISKVLYEKERKYFAVTSESMEKKFVAKTLEGMVFEMNQHLPMKFDPDMDFGSLTHVSINDNSIVWEMEIDTKFFYPPDFINASPKLDLALG